MYTEEQVKKKWCPISRTAVDGAPTNRGNTGGVYPEDCCIASACMMWRYQHPEYVTGDPHRDKNLMGYCGLAK
jgi:hypothetical protein